MIVPPPAARRSPLPAAIRRRRGGDADRRRPTCPGCPPWHGGPRRYSRRRQVTRRLGGGRCQAGPMGLELRPAVAADVDQIADAARRTWRAGRMRSTCGSSSTTTSGSTASRSSSTAHAWCPPRSLLDETLTVRHPGGRLDVAAGQVELVATDTGYEGRGLVRALMAWAHERSADARARPPGHDRDPVLLPGVRLRVRDRHPAGAAGARRCRAPDAGWSVRPATAGDVAAMDRLQDAAQAPRDVTMPRSAAEWRWVLGSDVIDDMGGRARRVGRRHGRSSGGEDEVVLDRGGRGRPGGGRCARRRRRRCRRVHVATRPQSLRCGPTARDRRPHGRAVLRAHLPTPPPCSTGGGRRSAARLSAAGLDRRGSRHRRVDVRRPLPDGRHRRRRGPGAAGGPMQAPGAAGGCGVAPDALPALLTGPHGMHGLARRRPDVYPGRRSRAVRDVVPAADVRPAHLVPARTDRPATRVRGAGRREQHALGRQHVLDWSGPAELVEAVVVDAGGVGQLVDHGDVDLLGEVVVVVAQLAQRRAGRC